MQEEIKQEDAGSSPLLPLDSLPQGLPNTEKKWNSGYWSAQQNLKCIAYFEFNKAHLHSKLKMKENKFFKQMSIFIDSRNPIQCRSQCQKLLRKYKTFYNIIHSFKNQLSELKFQEEYARYAQNPLIRFKGTLEMQSFERQAEMSREMAIQTEKSYLMRKLKQRETKRKTQQENSQAMNEFPFMRAGWWL